MEPQTYLLNLKIGMHNKFSVIVLKAIMSRNYNRFLILEIFKIEFAKIYSVVLGGDRICLRLQSAINTFNKG